MLTKERTDTVKNVFDITKQVAIAGLLIWFIADNARAREFFAARGFSIDRWFGAEEKKAAQAVANSAQVVNLQASANEKLILDLQGQLQNALAELITLRTQTSTPDSAGGGDLPRRPPLPSAQIARIDSVINLAGGIDDRTRDALQKTQTATIGLQRVLDLNEDILQMKPRSGAQQPMSWLIVFGSDSSVKAARNEIGKAAEKGFEGRAIVKRDTLFHPALTFDSEDKARRALEAAKSITRFSSGAFPIAIVQFCPGGAPEIDGIVHCLTSR